MLFIFLLAVNRNYILSTQKTSNILITRPAQVSDASSTFWSKVATYLSVFQPITCPSNNSHGQIEASASPGAVTKVWAHLVDIHINH